MNNKGIKIFFEQRSNRQYENLFFDFLSQLFNDFEHINANYVLSENLLKKYIDIPNVISKIQSYNNLSRLKRGKVVNELDKLPDKILVAKNIKDVSVDFVIQYEEKIQFIEFHEKQHKINSDKRKKPIFDIKLIRHETPRFVQRFLKDYWRWKYLNNYKIVWWDWFLENQDYSNLLNEDKKEYFMQGNFSFTEIFD